MKRSWYMLPALLAMQIAVFAEPAHICKRDNLRAKPFIDATVVLALTAGQQVDIRKREGSWYFIAVGKTTGWTPMLSVKRTTPAATVNTSGTPAAATGRSSTGTVVNTTGVRGLNEDTLTAAAFSEEAVAALEKNRVASIDAIQFATSGGLQPQRVPPLTATKNSGGNP